MRNKLALSLLLLAIVVVPEMASASGGITEFSSPLEKVVNTVTGPGRQVDIHRGHGLVRCDFHLEQG